MIAEWEVVTGDCREVLARLPDGVVQTCVSSPPYFALRDYAVDGQVGLEASPEAFVEALVAVYREVRRVLRDDGTCWVNIGDSYATGGRGGSSSGLNGRDQASSAILRKSGQHRRTPGYKDLDMLGIPWLLAAALRADGWYLRSEVIWEKAAPTPESISGWRWERCRRKVKGGEWLEEGRGASNGAPRLKHGHSDFVGKPEYEPCDGCAKCEDSDGLVLRRGAWRPTRSHEHVFLLAKSADYFCDDVAAREPVTGGAHARGSGINKKARAMVDEGAVRARQNVSFSAAVNELVGERNRRTVWRTGPQPFTARGLGADVEGVEHFAVFPPSLVEPMVEISTSAGGGCASCGAPLAPVAGDREPAEGQISGSKQRVLDVEGERQRLGTHVGSSVPYEPGRRRVEGWRPTCACGAGVAPQLVLDPFCGTGTVGVVAQRLGRSFLGVELNPDYARLARRRIAEDMPLFNRPAEKRT